MDETQNVASMTDVRNYFGMNAQEFRAEWTKLSAEDKLQIRAGIGNGSMNY